MCWLVLMALLLPLNGFGSGVVTGAALLSSLSSRELVRRRLVCLVMRPADGGKVWPRPRDFLIPLAGVVGETGSEGSRSSGDSGTCCTSSVLSFHVNDTRHILPCE
jgi:hypothetical protein